jgi:K+-sensing histidine kinase KdpD
MSTIICAVDGLTDSATALRAASHIAARTGATLLVAAVRATEAQAREVATELVHAHLEADEATIVPLAGDPATELARLADGTGATMIVVGARGKGRARTTFRSRLQRELAERASVPVLVAPSSPATPHAATQRPATNDPAQSQRTLPRAQRRTVRRWADRAPSIRPRPTTR